LASWLPERLPEDIDAERALLATLCAPGAELLAAEYAFQLEVRDFVHPAHQVTFRALRTLIEKGMEVNVLTLKDALDQTDDLNRVCGFAGLVELLAFEDVGRPQILVDLILRKAKLRRLVHIGAALVRQAAFEEETPETLVDTTTASMLGVTLEEEDTRGIQHVGAISEGALTPILEGRTAGVLTGYERFDDLVNGFAPGNLIVLAARPGIGKTALALNWLLAGSMKYGVGGAFFSLEMSKEEVTLRMISTLAQENLKEIQKLRGMVPPDTVRKLTDAREYLDSLPIYICADAGITVPEIRAHCMKMKAKGNKLEIVVIDYLQLVSTPDNGKGSQNEAVRIGQISRGLKVMAKEFGIPVVVLSQLNREVEHRQGGRPQLSDLRDSGAIEQDADLVAFIHRKMAPVAVGEEPDKNAELIIAKHRNGGCATIPMIFEGRYAQYTERVRETEAWGA
jgi:replicative DNA helicase